MPDLKNLPAGGEIVEIYGMGHFVLYQYAGVPLLWKIDKESDKASLYGPDQPYQVQHRWDATGYTQAGGVIVGVLGDIYNTDEDVLNGLAERFMRESQYKPYLREREVLVSIAEAAVENREWSAETDLVATKYWQTRTPGQREWDLLTASDPQAAHQRMATAQQKTKELLAQAGVQDNVGVSNEFALRWMTGAWTEQQLIDNVKRVSDPYAPGATTVTELLGGGWYGIHNGTHYLVQGGKHYVAYDPAEQERLRQMYGAPKVVGDRAQLGPPGEYDAGQQQMGGGWYGQYQGRDYLVANGRHYEAQTADEKKLLRDMLGAPAGVGDVAHLGAQGGMPVSQFMFSSQRLASGANGWQNPGVAGIDPTTLGGEERVRTLLKTWLGPMYAQGYSQEWIAQWAGRIRNGAEGEEDVLIEQLRATAKPLFGGREGSYEDLAAPWRGFWQRYSGAAPNEQNEALFLRLVNMNDAAAGEQLLREEGRKKNWAPVTQEFLGASQQVLGGQVVGAAA